MRVFFIIRLFLFIPIFLISQSFIFQWPPSNPSAFYNLTFDDTTSSYEGEKHSQDYIRLYTFDEFFADTYRNKVSELEIAEKVLSREQTLKSGDLLDGVFAFRSYPSEWDNNLTYIGYWKLTEKEIDFYVMSKLGNDSRELQILDGESRFYAEIMPQRGLIQLSEEYQFQAENEDKFWSFEIAFLLSIILSRLLSSLFLRRRDE